MSNLTRIYSFIEAKDLVKRLRKEDLRMYVNRDATKLRGLMFDDGEVRYSIVPTDKTLYDNRGKALTKTIRASYRYQDDTKLLSDEELLELLEDLK